MNVTNAGIEGIINRTELQELLDQVLRKSIYPEDEYEIAAIIESMGWNDSRVYQTFKINDIFELSVLLWDMIENKIHNSPITEEGRSSFGKKLILAIKSFIRGSVFAIPMAISVLSMLTLRFSLWSYEYLSTELATSIAIGTILSFMSIGGFTQIIARKGFFYVNQGFYKMAKKITFMFIRWGYIFCTIITLIIIIVNFFFNIFPFAMMMTIIVAYYIFLSSNWLSVTVMYILRKEFTFSMLLTSGIGVVFILFRVFGINIILSQIIALTFITIIGLLLVNYYFNSAIRKMEGGIEPPPPRKSVLVYLMRPFFLYGFVYFTFLFMDRILAWSTYNMYMPYIIWFRGAYELGLDFGLLVLIIPMGFSEVIVSRLMEDLEIIQKNSLSHEIDNLNRRYLWLYRRSMITITIISAISSVLVYMLVVYISRYGIFGDVSYLFSSTTYFVFVCALVAYSVLCFSLTNAVILFSLSQQDMVVKAILKGLLFNFIVGFILSRWVDYSYAVFGLIAGSIVFAVLSTRDAARVLKKLDYYMYAAL